MIAGLLFLFGIGFLGEVIAEVPSLLLQCKLSLLLFQLYGS
jgi:hypothetical protein